MNTKTALVVGATDGIGKQTALNLVHEGFFVLAVGRNPQKLTALQAQLGSRGQTYKADLSLLSETRRVGEEITAAYTVIDLIVHCADVLVTKRIETAEGHEISFATNYLSRFLLNSLLIDSLLHSPNPRLIHVAAAGMPMALKKEQFPVPPTASSFTGHTVGQISNDFYGLSLAERFPALTVNILNPGVVNTDIRNRMQGGTLAKMMIGVMSLLAKPMESSVEDYSALVMNIALGRNKEANNSVLINPQGKAMKVRKDRLDISLRQYIWQTSEKLTSNTQKRLSPFPSVLP